MPDRRSGSCPGASDPRRRRSPGALGGLMDITSPANPRIKRLVALRDRKERERESVFIVEGSRDLARAVANGHQPLEIYYDPSHFPDRRNAP